MFSYGSFKLLDQKHLSQQNKFLKKHTTHGKKQLFLHGIKLVKFNKIQIKTMSHESHSKQLQDFVPCLLTFIQNCKLKNYFFNEFKKNTLIFSHL